MKKIYWILTALVCSSVVSAENTVGYVKISNLKAFPTYISVYLEDGQTHNCNGGTPTTRFESDISINHHTSFLLSAFSSKKGVQFSYSCIDNKAIIQGVRLHSGY